MSDPFGMPLQGLHLLEASAGTGKTWTLMVLYLRQVLERELMPDKILAVTFTNASAAELRRRIRAVLSDAEATLRVGRPTVVTGVTDTGLLEALLKHYTGEERRRSKRSLLRAALSGFDRARVETIHGFCQRVLGDLAFGTATDYASVLSDRTEVTRKTWLRHWFQARMDQETVLAASRLQARFVQGGQDGVFELKLLDDLAQLADARPEDLRVLPKPVERPDFEGAHAAYLQAAATWQERWRQERDCVREWVRTDPVGFKSGQHRSDSVAKAFAAWDQESEPGELPKWLERFTTETLALAWQGDAGFRSQGCWLAADRFVAAFRHLEHASAQLETHLQQALIEEARSALRAERLRRGELSFDDLLQNLRSAVKDPDFAAELAQQLPVMLIDEFQDTDPVQWSIFSSLFRSGTEGQALYLVGDPKQAIYSFRHADLHTYLHAAQSEGVEVHRLDTNFRSQPELVDAINTLYGAQDVPFVLPEIEFHPVAAGRQEAPVLAGAPLTLCLIDRKTEKVMNVEVLRQAVAEDTASQIRELLTSGAITADRIAILVQKNAEAKLVAGILRRHGVPTVIAAQDPLFMSPVAGELLLLLRALLRPDSRPALLAAMGTQLLGYTAQQLRGLSEDEERLARVRQRFAQWRNVWRQWGAFPMLQSLLQDCNVPGRLLAEPEGHRVLTNLRQLMELLHTEQRRVAASPAALLTWYEECLRRDTGEQRRLATEAQAVQVVTMHKAKGLQWDLVFCSFLWSQPQDTSGFIRFNRPEHGLSLQLLAKPVSDAEALAQKSAANQRDQETEAERARLLYVALTRARERCVVHLGAVRQMAKKAVFGFFAPGHAPAALAKMTDEQLAQAFLSVPGRIEVERRTHPERLRYPLPSLEEGSPEREPVRARSRTTSSQWRRMSYSSLARGLESHGGSGEEQGWQEGEPVPLASFPKGARIGDFFHVLFEHHLQGPLELDLLAQLLRRHGLSGAMEPEILAEIFDRLRSVPVSGDFSLTSLTQQGQLPEASFLLPLAPGFRPRDLSAIIERYGGSSLSEYGTQLRALSDECVSGFLTGSIDLVYRHQGRWGLVDYKSNHLGDHRQDYGAESLTRVMTAHHYLLQGLIYGVAVLRMIRRKEPGADPFEHFDGARFLFLRGADEQGYGLYELPATRTLLLALDACFAGSPPQ